jgi:hypothetical protein
LTRAVPVRLVARSVGAVSDTVIPSGWRTAPV